MVHRDEDALVCDFAETYHLLDYRALPPLTAARLACGLSPDSRIMRTFSGQKAATREIFLAAILDRVNFLAWAQTDDARHGRNRPESVLEKLLGLESGRHSRGASFTDGEAFEKAKEKILRQKKHETEGETDG